MHDVPYYLACSYKIVQLVDNSKTAQKPKAMTVMYENLLSPLLATLRPTSSYIYSYIAPRKTVLGQILGYGGKSDFQLKMVSNPGICYILSSDDVKDFTALHMAHMCLLL